MITRCRFTFTVATGASINSKGSRSVVGTTGETSSVEGSVGAGREMGGAKLDLISGGKLRDSGTVVPAPFGMVEREPSGRVDRSPTPGMVLSAGLNGRSMGDIGTGVAAPGMVVVAPPGMVDDGSPGATFVRFGIVELAPFGMVVFGTVVFGIVLLARGDTKSSSRRSTGTKSSLGSVVAGFSGTVGLKVGVTSEFSFLVDVGDGE